MGTFREFEHTGWEDPATSGTVVGPTTDLAEGAALALRFRNATEH